MRRKELVPVALEGAGKQEHWAAAGDARNAGAERVGDWSTSCRRSIPLIIQRKRLQLFFDYEHRFEAYVPKEKRRFGYFALPVLVGDEIVAALDLKTDRKQRKLLVQKWTWVGRRRAGRAQGFEAPHRGRAAPFRAVSARGMRAIWFESLVFGKGRARQPIQPHPDNDPDAIG